MVGKQAVSSPSVRIDQTPSKKPMATRREWAAMGRQLKDWASRERDEKQRKEMLTAAAVAEALAVVAEPERDSGYGPLGRHDANELGYYSAALEGAKSWPQQKGSPEQILQHLKIKSQVNVGEIRATGLDAFLEGKKSVSKNEVIAHLEAHRIVRAHIPALPRQVRMYTPNAATRDEINDRHTQTDDTFRHYRRGWRVTMWALMASSVAAMMYLLNSFGISVVELFSLLTS